MTDKKKELFGIPEIPDPTLIDVMNAFHKLNSQLEGVEGSLAVAVDAVRGLGARSLKATKKCWRGWNCRVQTFT